MNRESQYSEETDIGDTGKKANTKREYISIYFRAIICRILALKFKYDAELKDMQICTIFAQNSYC